MPEFRQKGIAVKVLLPVDGSPASDAALDVLLRRFDPANTEVRVLHVFESPTTVSPSLAFAETAAAVDIMAERSEELRRYGRRVADRAVHRLHVAGFSANADVHDGEPRYEVVASATRWPADAIVIGSHGRSGFDRLLMGSVAEYVLRHASCAVEIVRPAFAAVKAS